MWALFIYNVCVKMPANFLPWPAIRYRPSDRMNLSKFRQDKVGKTFHSPWQGLLNVRNRLRRKINWAICRHHYRCLPITTTFFSVFECEIYVITLIRQPIFIHGQKTGKSRFFRLGLVFSNKYCADTQQLSFLNRKSWLDLNDVFKCTKAIGNLSLSAFPSVIIVTLQQVVSDLDFRLRSW